MTNDLIGGSRSNPPMRIYFFDARQTFSFLPLILNTSGTYPLVGLAVLNKRVNQGNKMCISSSTYSQKSQVICLPVHFKCTDKPIIN